MKEQLMGASNKFFYYVMSGRATFNIRLTLTLNNLNIETLKESFGEAIKRYPELAVKTVIKGNALTSIKNDAPIVFVPESDKVYHFGTKDTNGYLFYISYGENHFTLSYYHGISDVLGIVEFLRCAMYLYGEKEGFDFSEEEISELVSSFRQSEEDFDKGNMLDLLDPYNANKDENAEPDYQYDNRIAFNIPATTYPDDVYFYHECVITLKTSEVIALTKKLGVSAVPFICDVTSGAIRKEYEAGEAPVTAMVPVNFRPFCGSKTVVNCSDGILIPFEKEDEALSIEDRCLKWKDYMKKQMSEANFRKAMASKAKSVEDFEKDEMPLVERAELMTRVAPKDAKRPLSYAMTYPGKLTLLSGLDRMIDDYELKGWARANAVIGHSFKDTMRIQVLCRTDDNRLADCIFKSFKDLGLEADMVDNKRIYPDLVIMEELEKYE